MLAVKEKHAKNNDDSDGKKITDEIHSVTSFCWEDGICREISTIPVLPLYRSICVDSPVSYIDKNQACELPIKDKEMLLDIVEQAENYKAEYLVLEVSERAIEKGYVKDVPFDIKILTNLNPFHNKDF